MLSLFKKKNISGEWQKVSDLKAGMQIAVPKDGLIDAHGAGKISSREWIGDTDVVWDEIESIEYVGFEPVYDIEVADTHNFVGNNIFAHNTYANAALFNGGNVGIGTTSPWGTLAITQAANNQTGGVVISPNGGGSSYRSIWIATNGTLSFQSTSTTATLTTTGVWTNSSDRNFKYNVADLRYGLGTVMQLEPRQFNYKANGSAGVGFIAQELKQTIPEVVYGVDGSMTVDYGSLSAVALNAVKQMNSALNVTAALTGTSTLQSSYAGTAAPAITVNTIGNVGIGTTTPSATLAVQGNVVFAGLTSAGPNDQELCLGANNEVTVGAVCNASSIRFKDNVASVDSSTALSTVLALRPVSFTYKGATDTRLGFIAEEVKQLDPRLVVYEADGVTPHGVRYDEFAPLLAGAIQNVNGKVDALASTTIAIDARLMSLEGIIASSTAQTSGLSLGDVMSGLEGLGVKISQGVATLKSVFVESLTVGSHDKPAGITMYDEVTGDPYCLKVRNGAAVSLSGVCDTTATSTPVAGSDSGGSVSTTTPPITADTVAPVITIVGNNPATIFKGSGYADMGATVTDMGPNPLDPTGPLVQNNNLGLHFSVDGSTVTEVTIDTSTTTTHTIVYSAVDAAGNWAYATRTVEVIPMQ